MTKAKQTKEDGLYYFKEAMKLMNISVFKREGNKSVFDDKKGNSYWVPSRQQETMDIFNHKFMKRHNYSNLKKHMIKEEKKGNKSFIVFVIISLNNVDIYGYNILLLEKEDFDKESILVLNKETKKKAVFHFCLKK